MLTVTLTTSEIPVTPHVTCILDTIARISNPVPDDQPVEQIKYFG